jgi:hypothetical protein
MIDNNVTGNVPSAFDMLGLCTSLKSRTRLIARSPVRNSRRNRNRRAFFEKWPEIALRLNGSTGGRDARLLESSA